MEHVLLFPLLLVAMIIAIALMITVTTTVVVQMSWILAMMDSLAHFLLVMPRLVASTLT
jgi:hypothetical protein